jgi:ABC-type sugar transport system ATPase subunit
MAVIEAIELRRTYRTTTGVIRRKPLEVEAVRGVSFAVEQGELFGLLGPNGAGKTTTIKMLITLLLPTSGQARVLGHDVVADPRAVRKRIGYVFGGDRGLYERLSALDNLRYFAELYGVSGKAGPAAADRRGARARRPDGARARARRGLLALGCASACTSRAGSGTTPRWSSSMSRRSASIPSAPAICDRRLPTSSRRSRPSF